MYQNNNLTNTPFNANQWQGNMLIQYGVNAPTTCAPSEIRNHPRLEGIQLPIRNIHNSHSTMFGVMPEKLSKRLATPFDMTLHATLGAAMLCVTPVADVAVPGGWISPTSGMFILAAPSGSGKSPLEKAVFKVPNELEDSLLEQKFPDEFNPDDTNRHLFLLDDATGPAMKDTIHKVGFVSVVTTESSNSFDDWEKNTISFINKAHDGDTLRRIRSGPNGYAQKSEGARLFMYFGIQATTFDEFSTTKKGKHWWSVGAFNRCFYCRPAINYTTPTEPHEQSEFEELSKFRQRQAELLQLGFTPGYKRKVVKFDQKACERWMEIADWLRSQCAPGGYFHSVKEHATKLKDMVARVAAVIHVFEDFEGDISVSTLDMAMQFVLHFADYYVVQFTPIKQSILDAIKIDEILTRKLRLKGSAFKTPDDRYIQLEIVKDELDSNLTAKGRFEDALRELGTDGLNRAGVWEGINLTKNRRMRYVDLDPHWPCSPPSWLRLERRIW